MVTKIHPEPQTEITSAADEGGEDKTEERIVIEEPKKDEEEAPKPEENEQKPEPDEVEFINVGSLELPTPAEPPKSPSKPRQRGIGLENLKGLEYLQLRQTNRHMEDFANVQNNYDVEKSSKPADKVFYGMECTDPDVRAKVKSSTNSSQPFALKLIDRDDGGELVEVARNGLNDSPGLVYRLRLRKKEPVAAISLQYGWRKLAPTFSIFDTQGNLLMKAVGPSASTGLGKVILAKETTFTIYKEESDLRIGSIVKDGDIFEENKLPSNQEEVIRINYEDKLLDDMSKALILCTAFLLDYTQFKPPTNLQKVSSLVCFKCMN